MTPEDRASALMQAIAVVINSQDVREIFSPQTKKMVEKAITAAIEEERHAWIEQARVCPDCGAQRAASWSVWENEVFRSVGHCSKETLSLEQMKEVEDYLESKHNLK